MRLKLALVLALGAGSWGLPVLAHGVVLEHRQVGSVEVLAQYDTGEPMANAQVIVYAPDEPNEAWQQGTTDDQVMVRQAGHGGIITVPVSPEMADGAPPPASEGATTDSETAGSVPNSVISPGTNLSPVQRGITIGSVIWGFIGTALFFARGKR
jgi:nickel transport protein